ncbi:MAG: nucleotide exchange factor GrpE [Promethearchaeia archaeon]
MVFGNYFDDVINNRNRTQSRTNGSGDTVEISKQKLKQLIEKAEQHVALQKKCQKLEKEAKKLEEKLQNLQGNEEKLKELEKDSKKYYEALCRTRADLDNYRKRVDKEKTRDRESYRNTLLKKLLNHYDTLQIGWEAIQSSKNEEVKRGFQMVMKNYEKLMEEQGVKKMHCKGEKFDPYKHEAMVVRENKDLPNNEILEVIENGYYVDDPSNVLKPARVIISKKPREAQNGLQEAPLEVKSREEQ